MAIPGMPPQVLCYERADDLGFGVSGVVTQARAIRASFPDLDLSDIPMAAPVAEEKLVYLFDPIGASRRSLPLRAVERLLRILKPMVRLRHHAIEVPWIPEFLRKDHGFASLHGPVHAVGGRAADVGGERTDLAGRTGG